MDFLNSLLPLAVPLALILHGASTLIHAYITAKNGKDHGLILDQVVTSVDKFSNLVEKQQLAAKQNETVSSSGA